MLTEGIPDSQRRGNNSGQKRIILKNLQNPEPSSPPIQLLDCHQLREVPVLAKRFEESGGRDHVFFKCGFVQFHSQAGRRWDIHKTVSGEDTLAGEFFA